jgi:CubicO group peptidase (beta-lactamase class C family)
MRSRLNPLVLLPIALLPKVAAASPTPGDAATWRKISEKIEALRKRIHVPGVSVAVVQDDKVVFLKGFGLRDVATRKPVTPDTEFAIGSASKAFTCLLATQAQVDKKLDLSKSPSYYLPLFKPQGPDQAAKLTVSDLMCHRSGFPRTDTAWWAGGFAGDDIIRLLNAAHPIHRVGQEFLYQNLMVTLAGMVDEKVYGKPYADLVAERIFQPLGMGRTSARTQFLADQPDHATGYEPAGSLTPERPLELHNVDNVAPAGAIVSNARDLAQWVRLQLGNGQLDGKQLFSADAILEQRKPRIAVVGDMKYGYGWFLKTFKGTPEVDHGGNIDGFNADVSFLPEKHLGVAVLTNVSSGPVAAGVSDIVYEALVSAPAGAASKETVTKYAEESPSVVGRYANETIHLEVAVEKKGDKWNFMQGPVTLPMKLVADKAYAFDSPQAPKVKITFAPNEKDPKATDMVIEQSGMKFRLFKAKPYEPPMTGDALIEKMVAAQGGPAMMAKLGHMIEHYHAVMTSESVQVWGLLYSRSANDSANFAQLSALNRKFAEVLSFSTPEQSGSAVSAVRQYPSGGNPRAETDRLGLLHPKELYSKTGIIAEEKVGGEEAYVFDCLAKVGGAEVKLWVSKKTFLVLKRTNSSDGGAATLYGDYHPVEGVMVPFHQVVVAPDGAETVMDVDAVDFHSPIPDWPFKMPSSGKL